MYIIILQEGPIAIDNYAGIMFVFMSQLLIKRH